MCLRLCSDGAGMQSIAKCRRKRGVTGFLPPPGGAHAAHTDMSCKVNTKLLFSENTSARIYKRMNF